MLAFDIQRRRGGEVGTGQQSKIKNPHGPEGGPTSTRRIFNEPSVGSRLWSSSTGRGFLAGTSRCTGTELDCGRKSWNTPYTGRTIGSRSVARRPQHHHAYQGELHRHEGRSTGPIRKHKEEKTQMEDRTKRWRKPKIFKRRKWGKRKRKGWRKSPPPNSNVSAGTMAMVSVAL